MACPTWLSNDAAVGECIGQFRDLVELMVEHGGIESQATGNHFAKARAKFRVLMMPGAGRFVTYRNGASL